MGVALLGFQVVPDQPFYVAPEKYREIRGWFTGPEVVAELPDHTKISNLDQIISDYSPDYLECGIHQFSEIRNTPAPLILSGALPDIFLVADQLKADIDKIKYLITSAQQDFESLKKLCADFPVLLSVDNPKEEAILNATGAVGISLSGSAELKAGFKDYDRLAEWLELLEEQG